MRPKYVWGRVSAPTTETGLEQPKDVFSRKPAGYPMLAPASFAESASTARQAPRH